MNNVKKLIVAGVAALPLVFAMPAYAGQAGTNYAGVQYAMVTYDFDEFDDNKPTGVVGRFGHYISDTLAIEGRLGIGVSGGTDSVGVELSIDSLTGVYAVGHVPMSEKASFYGILGYSSAKVTGDDGVDTGTISDSGLSYGLGGDFEMGKNISANVEYMSYLKSEDNATAAYDVSAISLGVSFGF